jgi:hypothetical protein
MKTIKRFLHAAAIMILFVVFIKALFANENRNCSNNKDEQISLLKNDLLINNTTRSENRTGIDLGKFQFAFSYQGDYIEQIRKGQIWVKQDYGENDIRGYGDNDILCVDDICPNDELMDGSERREYGFKFSVIKYDLSEGKKEKGIFKVYATFSEDFQMLEDIQIFFTQNELYRKGEKVYYSIWAKNLPRIEGAFFNRMDFMFKKDVSTLHSVEYHMTGENIDIRNTKAIEGIGFNVNVQNKMK